MKFYFWNGVSGGMAFAIASSKSEAIELIISKYTENYRDKEIATVLRARLNKHKPQIFNEPVGFAFCG